MKKKVFLISIFLMSLVITAQEMKLEKESLDFGKQRANQELNEDITITNTGNAPLIITSVKPSCGCTVPSWPKNPIMPGKSGVISIKYKDDKKGIFNKVVEVYSNDVKKSRRIIRIKGEIQ